MPIRARRFVAGLCCVLLAGCTRVPDSGPLDVAAPLALGSPAELAARPPRLAIAAGELIVLSARQRDVDVTLELYGADGRRLTRSAAPAAGRGREWLIWEAPADLQVQVRVTVAEATEVAPSSQVRLELLRLPRAAGAAVRPAWRAQRAALEASAMPEQAVTRWREVEQQWRQRTRTDLAAEAALQVAAIEYLERQQWSAAAAAAERAAQDFAALGDLALQADAALLLGAARAELASIDPRVPADAIAGPLTSARRIYQQLGAPVAAAEALNFEGIAQFNRGDLEAAAAIFGRAAGEYRQADAPARYRIALMNLASVQFDRGDYRGSARSFDALLAGAASQDAAYQATLRLNSGWSLAVIGEPERAIERYLQALELAVSAKDDDLRARALHGLGAAHLQLGQTALAIDYLRQAVALAEAKGDPLLRAAWRDTLGSALREAGQVALATREHEAAIRALGRGGRQAVRGRVLLSLARDRADAGDPATALRGYDEVLALDLPPGSTVAIRARIGRARALAALGRNAAAIESLDGAIALAAVQELVEEGSFALAERARLHEAAGERAAALADSERAVALTQRLTAAATNPDNRVTYAQRVRAIYDLRIDLLAREGRAVDALAVADLANTRGIWARSDAPTGREPSTALYEMLAERRHRLDSLAEQGAAAEPRARAIEAEISVLRSRLAQARGANEIAAGATADLQRLPSALRRDDVLLVYSLGRERGWLWLGQRGALRLVELPGAAQVDVAVRRLLDRVRRLQPHDAPLDALRELVLPGVAPESLAGRRLLIVADGALGAVPWALVQSQLQAGSVLQLARVADAAVPAAGAPAPASRPPAQWRWALFGDPAFGGTERGRKLAPLPGTAAELAAVGAWAQPGLRTVYSGTAATRDALLGLPAERIDVLHVATHAELDAAVPDLAALVMARVDAQGRRIASDVRAADLLRWRRAPALVVLSACDAAAEPSSQAAGLMSLTRALLARRSQHVVASLWPVADASAADFMNAFYGALVEQGMAPELALAAAQRALASSPRWRAPFFWAGFVVYGAQP